MIANTRRQRQTVACLFHGCFVNVDVCIRTVIPRSIPDVALTHYVVILKQCIIESAIDKR